MRFNYLQYFLWKLGCEDAGTIKYCQTQYNKYASLGFSIFIVAVLMSLSLSYFLNKIFNLPAPAFLIIWIVFLIGALRHYAFIFYLLNYSDPSKVVRVIVGVGYIIITMPLLFASGFISLAPVIIKEQISVYCKINSITPASAGFKAIIDIADILVGMSSSDQTLKAVLLALSSILILLILLPVINYIMTSHAVYVAVKSKINTHL
jgi:hypothetical protein